MNRIFIVAALLSVIVGCDSVPVTSDAGNMRLRISENRRFFEKENGDPFFWLGDTGWLLFVKTTREDADKYLEDRKQKGFNVIQVMVLHIISGANVFGDSSLINKDVSRPDTTGGNDFSDSLQYDYWDHVDYIVDNAAKKGIYIAMVAVWGEIVLNGNVNVEQAKSYATFLADRYKNRPNIIWVNGGDIIGTDSTEVWNIIGSTLMARDTGHLVTFHPFGRTQSSTWFHDKAWLDFNMFQSGHNSYEQDTAKEIFSESNWKFMEIDYNKVPVKPSLDGEPSYEGIPKGLHDTTQPRWQAADVRRYGYWSVFAGGAGHTYGNNSVMQFHVPTDKGSAFASNEMWVDAIHNPGAGQMGNLKKLMLSRPYFDRVPDQTLIASQGEKYNYLAATRGKDYAFIYTFNGRNIQVNMGKVAGTEVKASWFSPVDGSTKELKVFPNQGVLTFDPPGEQRDGNDWVLILDSQ